MNGRQTARSWRAVIACSIAALVLLGTLASAEAAPSSAPVSNVTKAPVTASGSMFRLGARSTVNQLEVGVTHTQMTANHWDPNAAVTREQSILSQIPLQNEMIMGWGPRSPEPSPGVYDFGGLDARLAFIRATGATPVVTLCCAPDWMKGGRPGQTDWSQLSVAPKPQYYSAFAQLAVTIAKRYPDVHYFQVWSELKGFFDHTKNRWNYEAYTQFYNTVYDALKAYNPALKIGGPYVVFNSYLGAQSNPSAIHGTWGRLDQRPLDVVKYWLAHKHGADFVAIDGGTLSAARRHGPAEPFAGVTKLAAVTRWVRSHTSLPIWWSEMYPYQAETSVGPGLASAATADALLALARAGAAAVLLWQEPHPHGFCVGPCLWTDTERSGGGQLTKTGSTVLQVMSLLTRGAVIRTVARLPHGVAGFAIGAHVVLINTTSRATAVASPHGTLSLAGYETTITALT